MRVMEAHGLPLPIFKPSRDRGDVLGVIPLQAADLAAYELRKWCKDFGNRAPWRKYRGSLRALSAIDGWWGEYSEDRLNELCESLGIRHRPTNSAL
jgi:hypothetical protein